MSTVAELRQQLETLKKRNGDEIAQATKEVERLQKELEDIAAITEPIERKSTNFNANACRDAVTAMIPKAATRELPFYQMLCWV
ncbi:hypothetical protein DPX39_100079300 [Trypanosoma brucei equiperdum]|uniref:Uncharacterized protein n=1 Tax=Trypanosoma brucei equiperdum TaxID=630700 RepID=A0A3L6L4Z1_9TRYP|nr:hypothetical protein DPX39_100079300 [Trypanosoma brucei equiperdum]